MTTSPSDADLRRSAELRLVASDIRWSWGIARDAAAQIISSPIPLLCVMPYLSLIVYESQKYLVEWEPTLAQTLALQYADVIEQSRHRIKLFDDTHLGMEGVAESFSEDLMAAHRAMFIQRVRLPLAALWKADLGLFTYGGRQIATTHVVHFNLGTSPDMLRRSHENVTKGVGEDMGKYLAVLSDALKPLFPQLNWDVESFLGQIDSSRLTHKDVRSSKYYTSHFGEQLPVGIVAALDAFRCALNTIDALISTDTSPGAAEAIFKIRFVTLYHVLKGLQQLHSVHSQVLDQEADQRLIDIEQHATTLMLQTDKARWCRNTLIHYGLSNSVPTVDIDPQKPLAGLAVFYFPGVGFSKLATEVQEHAELVARSLDDWAGQGSGA
jgi:hypothetical protein